MIIKDNRETVTEHEAAEIIGTKQSYVGTLAKSGKLTIADPKRPRKLYLDEVREYAKHMEQRRDFQAHPEEKLSTKSLKQGKCNYFRRGRLHRSQLERALSKTGYRLIEVEPTNKQARFQVVDLENNEIVVGKDEPKNLKEVAELMDRKFDEENIYGNTPVDQRGWNVDKEVFVRAYAAHRFGKALGLDFPRCHSQFSITQYGRMYDSKKCVWVTPHKVEAKRKKKGESDYYIKFYTKFNGKTVSFNAARLTALFFCPNRKRKKKVHHIDIDPSNNNYKNLIWVTQAEHGELHRLYNAGQKDEYDAMLERIKHNNGGKKAVFVRVDDYIVEDDD